MAMSAPRKEKRSVTTIGVDATHTLAVMTIATGATPTAEAEAASAINAAAELIGLVVANAIVAPYPLELVVDAVDVDKRAEMIESVGLAVVIGV
jgi:predicted hydrolase (HD superfamily)